MAAVKEKSTTPQLRILGDCSVPLWGLSSTERLLRQLRNAGITGAVDEGDNINGSVILLRADYVYDQRIIGNMVAAHETVLDARNGEQVVPVAAHVNAAIAPRVERLLLGETRAAAALPIRHVTAESLSGAYIEELLKTEAPLLLPLRAERQGEIEKRLFDGSYKGVTDIVTKYVWPIPARWATRLCANTGIRPNHVTLVGLACVLAATVLFAFGWFGTGLVFAWFMTFLDTVDGKLARVTVDSTRLGHALDKSVDLIHPPFWYIAWGLGLSLSSAAIAPDFLTQLLAAIIGGYIAGRLAEGAFTLFLGGFSMFTWRSFDSSFRLILARRNPSLIVLTVSLVLGRPDAGLIVVAVWHLVSAAVLWGRLLQAIYVRVTAGPLRPWLQELPRPPRSPDTPGVPGGATTARG